MLKLGEMSKKNRSEKDRKREEKEYLGRMESSVALE